MRDFTGVMHDQTRTRWHTIGTLVCRGCRCLRISTITIRSGGRRFAVISHCVCGFDKDYSGADVPQETKGPIIYTSLQEWHLGQVHDLLTRTFWSGIDSTSSETSIHFTSNQEQSVTPYSTNRNFQRS